MKGRTVLITGAKGGLGAFVTNAFLEAGARVVGVSRSIKDADFPHSNFTAIPAELTNGENAVAVAAAALAKWGRIDALVHLMGGYTGGASIADTGDATLTRMMEMNFNAAFYMMRAVIPQMRAQKAGRILAIGSLAAIQPSPMSGAYAASKAALVSLINSVAAENFEHGITANAVLPGAIDTAANRAAMPGADFTKWVPPGQIAELLVYLASNATSYINGTAIPLHEG